MSEVKVNKISPRSGTDVQLGDSGDTITVPSGATFDASNATTTLPATVVTTDGSQTLTNKTIDASQLTGTITPSDNTVTNAKIVDSTIQLAKLSATGTKDATTFLRGDNTFAEAGGGKVLQVVQASTTTSYTTSSSSFVAASGMEVSITPSATSSKVLVFVTMNFQEGVAGSGAYATIYRNNTTNLEANGFVYHGLATGASYKFSSQEPMHYLDSPNTTSATTYTVYFSRDGSGSATVNFNNSRGVITAIEIGA